MKPTARILKHKRTLVDYDGPQLFVGLDQIGTQYVCLATKEGKHSIQFICTPLSNSRLENFLEGELDLRDMILNPETGERFLAEVVDLSEDINLFPFSEESVAEEFLPLPGFVLDKDPPERQVVQKEAVASGNAVLELSFNPEEARARSGEAGIEIPTLATGMIVFSNLVKHVFKKGLRTLDRSTRAILDRPENSLLNAYAASPSGSFTIHLRSVAHADLTGHIAIVNAFKTIDTIVDSLAEPESAIETLKGFRGHVVGDLKKLLELISVHNAPLSYSWAGPDGSTYSSKRISRRIADPVYHLLKQRTELAVEEREFTGLFLDVGTSHGKMTWTFESTDDGREYRGKSIVGLGGVTVRTSLYHIHCIERLHTETISGKEKTTLELKSIELLSD
jgi:hypothetical protein